MELKALLQTYAKVREPSNFEYGELPEGTAYDMDAMSLLSKPTNMEIIANRFSEVLDPARYDMITGVETEGLALGSILGLRFGLGISYVRHHSWGADWPRWEKEQPSLRYVRDKRVLLTRGVMKVMYWEASAIKNILTHGGLPITLAAILDADTHPGRKGMTAKEQLIYSFQTYGEPQKVLDLIEKIDIVPLAKASELTLGST